MFVTFLLKIFILTKMKSYGYKLINYVFSVAVYDLLPLSTNLSMPFRQKSTGEVWENF